MRISDWSSDVCSSDLPSTGRKGLTEDERVANGRNVLALFQQVEIPAAVGGIAVKNRADQTIILHADALVDPARCIAQDDVLGAIDDRQVPGRKNVAPRYLTSC